MRWINCAFIVLSLAACTQREPSRVNPMPMRTAIETQEITLNSDVDIAQAADTWKRGARSPLNLIATYRDGMETTADKNAAVAASRLRALGVTDIQVSTLPAATTQIIASMKTLTAGADPSCRTLPLSGPSISDYDFGSYRLGCTEDTILGKQIAHTEDLEGRVAGTNTDRDADATRQGNVVDTYRTGKPNEPLKGLAASDIAERQN